MRRWYLIHTKPSSEMLALINLLRQSYEVYLPRVVQTARRAALRYERIAALFPRYLFVRLNEGQQVLAPVASTVGATGVVRFGSRYAIVPDGVVEDLRSRADPVSGLHRLHCGPTPVPGAPVRVSHGPFDGLDGVFERQAGSERVVVLLGVLGQNGSVCVSADCGALTAV